MSEAAKRFVDDLKQIVGFDLGSKEMITAVAATRFDLSLRTGDHVRASRDTNRIRRRVVNVLDSHTAELRTFIRPSRGYAKHVRRNKSHEH